MGRSAQVTGSLDILFNNAGIGPHKDALEVTPEEWRKVLDVNLNGIFYVATAFARYLDKHSVPVWIRHVVVPDITYKQELLYRLGHFIGSLHNVEALDILPYHDMGKGKYQKLGISYPLEKVSPLGREEAAAARQIVLAGIQDEHHQKNCHQLLEAN